MDMYTSGVHVKEGVGEGIVDLNPLERTGEDRYIFTSFLGVIYPSERLCWSTACTSRPLGVLSGELWGEGDSLVTHPSAIIINYDD
jgi:hypothetical protein